MEEGGAGGDRRVGRRGRCKSKKKKTIETADKEIAKKYRSRGRRVRGFIVLPVANVRVNSDMGRPPPPRR